MCRPSLVYINILIPYTDIDKAYLRILVDDETAGLRIFIWYDDLENLQNPVFYLRITVDFGDEVASSILTIAQKKTVASLFKLCFVTQNHSKSSIC